MKKIFSTIAVASALFAGYTTYNAQHNTELTDIALANVEALATDASDNTSGNERPRYINKTRIKSREEIRTEVNASGITFEYERTCTDIITRCEHTGEDKDICYVDLNETSTTCEGWTEK